MHRIMICDDNLSISDVLSRYFEQDDNEVITAATGTDALRAFKSSGFDLMILDVMLPDMSGLDVLKRIRAESDVPILMLSAKADEFDRILGLEIGADDYVTKPFSPHEVYVRCNKMLRKREQLASKKVYTIAELTIYPDTYEVYVSGKKIDLTRKEFLALKYLAGHTGQVVTRDHIINDVWGIEYVGAPRIVDTLITRLRKKLFYESNTKLHFDIETVFGVGYMLEETK